MGVMDVIRGAFQEARDYRQEWAEKYGRAVKAKKKPLPPRRDFKLERLVEILEGERLVHAHSYRADEILQLMRVAEEFGFKIRTLQHVLEGYKVADEIAAHGAGASTFSDWWGYKVEAYDAIPHNAALMTRARRSRFDQLRQWRGDAPPEPGGRQGDEVGRARRNRGAPARHLEPGEAARHRGPRGSIEVGKDADLVLYDGPPMSVFSVVQKTFVDGDLYFDREADIERQAAIDAIRQKLEPEDGEKAEAPARRARRREPRWSEPTYSCQEEGR